MNPQPSVLIVDDKEPILLAMKEYFASHGFAVDCSDDLRSAETLVAAKRYAAIITDLRLTARDDTHGFDLITYARERWPNICIIMLTSYGSLQAEAEARRRGVDAFLGKPKPLSEVKRTLCKILASRQGLVQGKVGSDE